MAVPYPNYTTYGDSNFGVAFLNRRPHKGRVLLGTGTAFGVTLILFAAVSNTGNFGLSLGILALTGMTGTAFMALTNVMLLTITPPEMRGRVMGLYMSTMGLTALGAYPMGAIFDLLGAPLAMLIFGALTLSSVVIILALRPQVARL